MSIIVTQDELVAQREKLVKKSCSLARSAAKVRKQIEELDEWIGKTIHFGIGDYIHYVHKNSFSGEVIDMYMHIKALETPYKDYVIGFRSACVELGKSPFFNPNHLYYFKKKEIEKVEVIDRKEYLKAFNKLKKNI